jgi:hypothetical protein
MIFHPTAAEQAFPSTLGGMRVVREWRDVLEMVEEGQRAVGRGGPGQPLSAVVYPCSSLQVLA